MTRHVKVLSDKVQHVSSPEARKKTCIRERARPQEKALAIGRTVVKYRHQTNPPNENLLDNVHDVFQTVPGYDEPLAWPLTATMPKRFTVEVPSDMR